MMVLTSVSQRLYKATGWASGQWWAPWPYDDPESTALVLISSSDKPLVKYGKFPAYGLDYLMEKLGAPLIIMHHSEGWRASQNGYNGSAATIQDAVAELAIAINGGTDGKSM